MRQVTGSFFGISYTRGLWVRFALLALIFLMLIASCLWVWRNLSTPVDTEEKITLATYRHNGSFDYSVYLHPSHLFGTPPSAATTGPAAESKYIYYRNIVDDIQFEYNYKFVPETPVIDVSSVIDVEAIVKGPSGWSKIYPIEHTTRQGDSFSVPLELRLEDFETRIDTIEKELGFYMSPAGSTTPYSMIIQASVAVSANTTAGAVRDTFSQQVGISIGRGMIEWDKELNKSKTNIDNGLVYQHQGRFHYSLSLKSNSLFDVGSLSPAVYDMPALVARPPGEVYFTKLVDIMKGSFNYEFTADTAINNLVTEAEVKAVLEYPDTWAKSFTLVPRTVKRGPFTVSFPVDIKQYEALSDTIREEIGRGATAYTVTLTASVHTTAELSTGRIDEVFIQSVKGVIGQGTITWSSDLDKTQAESVTKTNMLHDPNVYLLRALSLVVMVLILVGFCFMVWNIVQARVPVPDTVKEAARAKKKYKNVIVDVAVLPPMKGDEVVIPLGSIDELVKVADSLLKPVLHQVVANTHIYYVIDGSTRYEYISGLSY